MEEHMSYLHQFWQYFPYMLYAYVFLTLLPKSFRRIQKFADSDYAANRTKYHRCYAPEFCCHTLAATNVQAVKTKVRKSVMRTYPKHNDSSASSVKTSSNSPSEHSSYTGPRRAVQTYTQVNKIARMFETGGRTGNYTNNNSTNNYIDKKVNRVPPIIVPTTKETANIIPAKKPLQRCSSAEELAKMLLKENLLSMQDFENPHWTQNDDHVTPTTTATNSLCGGTSDTPSTASPAASCSPLSASPRQLSPGPVEVSRSFAHYKSSLDDIFAAIANNAETQYICSEDVAASLSPPVTSIDDILSQRRLSRPLSAYSISDLLLNEENSQISYTKCTLLYAQEKLLQYS